MSEISKKFNAYTKYFNEASFYHPEYINHNYEKPEIKTLVKGVYQSL